MNQEIKQKWVAALRSGEYEQGKELLRNSNNQFCCLGVLCDLYAKEHQVAWDVPGKHQRSVTFMEEIVYPPQCVAEWADIHRVGMVRTTNGIYYLPRLNDTGDSFAQIADLIEQHM